MFCCRHFYCVRIEQHCKHRSIEFLTTQTHQTKRDILIDYVLIIDNEAIAVQILRDFLPCSQLNVLQPVFTYNIIANCSTFVARVGPAGPFLRLSYCLTFPDLRDITASLPLKFLKYGAEKQKDHLPKRRKRLDTS